MEQTKRSWTVKFLITAIFAFVAGLTLGFGFMPSNEKMTVFAEEAVQTRPEDSVCGTISMLTVASFRLVMFLCRYNKYTYL